MARDYLCGEVAGFHCDVGALREYYEREIRSKPSKPYFDNGANYVGWAMTSRDGSIHDAIQHIPLKKSAPGTGTSSARSATVPTPLCRGPVKAALDSLSSLGLSLYRVRVMALDDHGFDMVFHRDAKRESWRLHIPIITTPGSFFEWQFGDEIVRKHLPADGRAWFVRVDPMHRAVNEAEGKGQRVHLLMGLSGNPAPWRLGPESTLLPHTQTPAA